MDGVLCGSLTGWGRQGRRESGELGVGMLRGGGGGGIGGGRLKGVGGGG